MVRDGLSDALERQAAAGANEAVSASARTLPVACVEAPGGPLVDVWPVSEAKTEAAVRRAGSRAVSSLLPYLGHSHEEFRASVAHALAHQASQASLIVPALEAALAVESADKTRDAMQSALSLLRRRE